jgi:hypothetical protein
VKLQRSSSDAGDRWAVTRLRRLKMRKALVVVVAALAAVVLGSAAQAGTIQVSGVQSASQPDGSKLMSGSLIGLWWTTSFYVSGFEASGTGRGGGTETFVGCLDANGSGTCDTGDATGTIDFAFTFTAKYDPSFTTELRGRCHHPVVGGTGDFAGVTGVLDFKDDPVTGCAYYRGHLDLR